MAHHVVAIPSLLPTTLTECQELTLRLRDDLDRLAAKYDERETLWHGTMASMVDSRKEAEHLRARVRELEEEVLFFQGNANRATTRAETVESRLKELEGCARYTDRALAAMRGPEDSLCLVYELGALALLRLANTPAPTHPRFLVERMFIEHGFGDCCVTNRKSGVEHDEAVAASRTVADGGLPKGDDQGHECDAHSRAREHEDRRAGGVAGHST